MYCTKCGKELKSGNFYPSLRTRCKECVKKESKDRYHRVAAEDPLLGRRESLKKRYGLSLEDYDAMLETQHGRCAICGALPSGKRAYLQVDHCHDTKEVRGLLCSYCNRFLAVIERDGIEAFKKFLAASFEYLGAVA